MEKLKAIILATGTEIGKTYISCALLRRVRTKGRSVGAVKPVMSGFSADAVAESDAGQLAAACGETAIKENLARYCRFSFEEALAPNVAARRASVDIRFDDLVAFSRGGLHAGADFTLVEGAGGVLSPLTDTHLNVDLAIALGLPVVMVTANYLGSVTHTLTALEACRRRGVAVASLAVSKPTPEYGAPAEIAEELGRWSDVPSALFPHASAPDDAAEIQKGADTILQRLEAFAARA